MQTVASFVPIPRRRRVTESQIDSAEIIKQQQQQQQPQPVQAPPAPPPSKRTVASMLGCVIEQVIGQSSHEQLQQDNVLLSSFTSTSEPPISVADYLFRLGSLIDNESTLVLAVYHIRTVLRVRPGFAITALNIHRLLLASLLCAVKVHEDKFYRNTQYAKVGGVLLQEINQLEFEFLSLVDFNLHVKGEEYEVFYKEMTNHELHSGCKCAYGAALSTASPVSLGPARSKSQARLRPTNGAASPLQLFYSPSPSSPLSRSSTPGGGDSSSSAMSPYLAAHSPAMSSLSLGSSPIPLFPSTPTTPLPACSTNWTPADLLREPSRERIENPSSSSSNSLPSASSSMPTLHEVAGETAESAEELRQQRQQQQQTQQQINQSVQQMQHAPPPTQAYQAYQQQQQLQQQPQTPQQPQFQPRRPTTAYSSAQRSQSFSGPSSSASFTPIEQAQLQHQIHQQQQLQQLQQFQQQLQQQPVQA